MPTKHTSDKVLSIFLAFAQELMKQRTVDNLLWYVAEEVVAEIGFVDCVIYAYDAETQTLHQAAAIGDKTPTRRTIVNPLVIKLGDGVTGTCAQECQPILLHDAGSHPKYIPDLSPPGAELCVPIMDNDTLLGAIDCEHPSLGAFDNDDLELLKSVASLTAAQWLQCNLVQSLESKTQKLSVAEKKADQANKAKSVFLSNMSHEIRTPLHGVLSATQLLERTDLSAVQQNYISIITGSGSILHNLIEDVLDFTQIESGDMIWKNKPIDLSVQIKAILSSFDSMMRQKDLQFDCTIGSDVPDFISTDSKRFAQILTNLLSNAQKYTQYGSVKLDITLADKHRLLVKVTDTGTGLTETEQKTVFNRFARTESAQKSAIQGSGIGLALCKELIQIASGEIGVVSKVGVGSTFWFELPFDQVTTTNRPINEKPTSLREIETKNEQSHLVLVVDDNEMNRLLASKFLNAAGLRVETANDGVEAVSKALQYNYDAILLDQRMPNMQGDEALTLIRDSNKWNADVPIYMLTGDATSDVRHKLLQLGATDFFAKPLKFPDLLARLKMDIEKYHNHKTALIS